MEMDFIKDRLTQGFLAGVAGWPLQVVFTHTMYWLHLTKYRYLDFAAVLTFNRLPKGWLDSLLAEFVVVVFLGVLGIIFAMLIKVVTSMNLYFKGLLYGTFMWFAIYSAMTMYELKHIYPVDPMTAFLTLVAASMWSVGMTWTLLFLNRKYGVKN
jgi:hypothetical protein